MNEKDEEKSFGELPTLGHEEPERPEVEAGDGPSWDTLGLSEAETLGHKRTMRTGIPVEAGPSWSALGLSEAETLKPLERAEGIVDDGRTDRARRWKAGEEILGRYVVERELGQGGMGVVYGCLDKVGGVRVAVKGLPPELSHDSIEMEEVRENFRLVGDLRHPSIAGVRTLEKDAWGEFYLVMDLAEGESLRKWERRKWRAGGVSLAEAVPILRQMASALDYAHGRKIVHRDVKPGNVMIDEKGEIKVLDFGLADQIRTSLSRASHASRGTSGTGPYMSPEQWRGQPQDGKTDQYALGVMAYEMLAGRLPFGSSDLSVLREVVLKEEPAAIPGLSDSTMGAIRQAMAKRAEERFGSCREFVEALEGKRRIEREERTGTEDPDARPRHGSNSAAVSGKGKKWRKVAGWVGALVLAAGVGGGWWWWQEKAARQAEEEATRKQEEVEQSEQKAAEREALKGEVYNLAAQAKIRGEEVQRAGGVNGQGFGMRLTSMKVNLGRGEAALQGQDFGKAKEFFETALAEAGWVETNMPLWEVAVAKKQLAEEARQKADGMEGAQWGEKDYQAGKRMQAAADAAFEDGEFKVAAESWEKATIAYGQSEIAARAMKEDMAGGDLVREVLEEGVKAATGVQALNGKGMQAATLQKMPEATTTGGGRANPTGLVEAKGVDDHISTSPAITRIPWPKEMSNRSETKRSAAIATFGGKWGPYAESAVLRALEWLRVLQNKDGSWGNSNKEAMCGLGLLTFLAHGETTASEKYGPTVEKAIRYLCAKQNENGEFSKITPNGAAGIYAQAICVYAISEAYAMTHVSALKSIMEKGVQVIINGQQPGGGFDYGWKKESRRDTSLGGWCCQAMKAAYIAGADNQGLHEAMEKSIKDMKGAQREDGYFIYADGRGRITNMTAIACLSMQLLGHGEDKEVKDGMKWLSSAECSWDKPAECPLYAWYYLSQAKFHVGGNTWSSWNNKFAPLYIRHQNPDGSWLSPGVTGFKEGKDTVEREWMGSDIDSKVYATTLAALTLQVYYRFLPTYKPIETATEEASDGDVAIEIL